MFASKLVAEIPSVLFPNQKFVIRNCMAMTAEYNVTEEQVNKGAKYYFAVHQTDVDFYCGVLSNDNQQRSVRYV